ncbi:TonB-dependent siderophore receptor [Opitutaceae bacterium TAV1]|nr:TonB-dependent siderophore receptor [Opitutaceae bacterium TAV1]
MSSANQTPDSSSSTCGATTTTAAAPLSASSQAFRAFALLSPLVMAGSLGAQVAADPAATAPAGTPPADPAADGADKVELPALDIAGSREKQLSSPKFTEPVLDTPQTIVIIPQEVFNQQGAANLSDVLRNTPGITFTAGETGNPGGGDAFTMRGFDTSGSIFVDGVRDTGTYKRDIYNIEQVEIAKGPAGADNGRGGSSGYVNLSTKTPQPGTFVNGTASYGISEHGGEDQRRITADYNQDLGAAGAAFRLNLMGQDSGLPGRDFAEDTGWGISPSVAFGLGTPTRLVIAGSWDEQHNIPDSGIPVGALPGQAPGLAPVDQTNFYGLATDYDDVVHRSIMARVEHDLSPDTTIRNQTVFTKTERDAVTTYPGSSNTATFDPVTGLVTPRTVRSEQDNDILSNQTNLTTRFDTGSLRHDFSAGFDLTRENQYVPTWSNITTGTPTDVHNPDPHRPSPQPTRAANGAYARSTIDTAALYAFDTIHITDKLLVNLSGRWEKYWTNYKALATDDTFSRIKASDDLFSWKAGVAYKPVKEGTLYAAYGNSMIPPGSTFTLSAAAGNANNPNTDPQEARNYETGVKWEFFESRLLATLAYFYSENTNVPVSTGDPLVPFRYDSSQVVQGIELGLSGKITDNWLVFAGFAWMDSENKTPSAAPGTTTDGADLRFTPKLSGNLWTTYRFPFGLTIGGGVQYVDTVSRATNTATTPTATSLADVPDYWLFNGLASYEVNRHLTLRLNVNNIFDEDYYRLNNNGGRYYPGASRTFVLSADVSF